MQKLKKEIDVKSIKPPIKYLFYTFMMIYISNDTLLFGTTEGAASFSTIIYIALILIILLTDFKKILKINSALPFIYLITSIMFIILTGALNNELTGGYLYQILVFVLCFALFKIVSFDYFIISFRKILYFLSVASIIIYLIVLIVPSLLNYVPIVENISGVEYYNFYVGSIIDNSFSNIYRSSSIFREPGVFMMYIIFALLIEVYLYIKYRKPLDYRYISVWTVSLLLTFSTAGYIIFAVLLIYLSFSVKLIRNLKIVFFIGLIILISTFFIGDIIDKTQVFGKLSFDSTHHYGSTLSRLSSIVVPLNIFLDNIFFGVGLTEFSVLYREVALEIYQIPFNAGGHSTNTIMNKFATYGVFFGLFYIYSYYLLAKLLSNKTQTLLLFLIFISLLANEEVRYSLIFSILPYYALNNKYVTLHRNLHNISR